MQDVIERPAIIVSFQLFETDKGLVWRQDHVETAPFYTSKEVDQLITKVEVSLTCYSTPAL
jgi:hypothetical protein